jgi:hypothetical protein
MNEMQLLGFIQNRAREMTINFSPEVQLIVGNLIPNMASLMVSDLCTNKHHMVDPQLGCRKNHFHKPSF